MRRFTLLAAAAAIALTGAVDAKPVKKAVRHASATTAKKPMYGSFGVDLAGMDRSVTPGQDFGEYVNGTYLKKLVIPADRSNFGMFTKLRDLSQERTRAIIAAAALTKAAPGSEAQKVGDFYASFIDEAAIEAKGLTPLAPRLAEIAAIKDRAALATAFGDASRDGVDVPVNVGPQQDLKNPDIYNVYIEQGGLGMPDRDYYLDAANPKFADIRTKYQQYIVDMLKLANIPNAEARGKAIYDLEAKIAKVHWTKVEQRQVEKTYNPVSRTDIEGKYAGIEWTSLLGAAGVGGRPEFIISSPSAVQGMAKLIKGESLDTWKDYMAFHTLDRWAPMLPKKFVDLKFAFTGTVLSGQPENQPRWKRGVDATSNALGEAVGKLYVAKYFPPAAKAKADELVRNIIAAMDERLGNLTWMDPKTKTEARAKLAAFTPKIGYPDKWRDYSSLEVVRGDALGNAMRSARFNYQARGPTRSASRSTAASGA